MSSAATGEQLQIESLVVLKIIKHSTTCWPTTATGCLVGMDTAQHLEVTNSFSFPTTTPDTNTSTDQYSQNDAASIAAAAPRSKSMAAYSAEMIKYLREVNVDAQGVGWYMSTSMGNFINQNFVENQIFYQRALDTKCVALVFDVSKSTNGNLSLKAYRLSTTFMASYKEGKFTTESLQKSQLRHQDILVEVPVTIKNSHLLTSFLSQLPKHQTASAPQQPTTIHDILRDSSISQTPIAPNLDILDLSVDPFLEKTCDLLLDSIENHQTEQNNFQYWQRALGREQAKITAWQQKRKAENAARTASKQPLLDENEYQKLFKLPQEPSRLDALLVSRQVEQYARQVDGFSAVVSAKMFAVRQNLTPGEVL